MTDAGAGNGGLEPYDSAEYPAAEAISERARGVALALALVAGPLGLHRFYLGRPRSGVLMILTLGGLGVWWLYDLVTLAVGEFHDGSGRRVRRWRVEEHPDPASRFGGGRGLDALPERIDVLERQLSELGERLDFAERLLAQQRDRDRLPR